LKRKLCEFRIHFILDLSLTPDVFSVVFIVVGTCLELLDHSQSIGFDPLFKALCNFFCEFHIDFIYLSCTTDYCV